MQSRKKIAIITGDYPPFISGYSDYNYNLLREMKYRKIDAYLITTQNNHLMSNVKILGVKWNLLAIAKIFHFLKSENIENVNIQYPNIMYGRYNITPHLIVMSLRLFRFKISTTLHEYSNINIFRRISEVVFLIFSNKIIVSSIIEKETIKKFLPMFEKKIRIIHIASNIKVVNSSSNFDMNVIAYFGKFYPDRNIKEVIKFMKSIEDIGTKKYSFKMIGARHHLFIDYLEEMITFSKNEVKSIEWIIDKSLSEIENIFKEIHTMVLFYNDGASLRRGSLMASIVNGIPIITNKGKYDEEISMLEGTGIFYTDLSIDRNRKLMSVLSDNSIFYNKCFNELKEYSTQFSFARVAADYELFLLK